MRFSETECSIEFFDRKTQTPVRTTQAALYVVNASFFVYRPAAGAGLPQGQRLRLGGKRLTHLSVERQLRS